MEPYAVIRGGGDLATGVAVRLHRAGIKVVILELPQPLVVRRTVAFAEAVYQGQTTVEGITAVLIDSLDLIPEVFYGGHVPVLIDPDMSLCQTISPLVLVDARLKKRLQSYHLGIAGLIIGLGPGFVPGENCHAAIETKRGHTLGRVLWQEMPEENSGIPEKVASGGKSYSSERVLRAPVDGVFSSMMKIGTAVKAGAVIGNVDSIPVYAPFDGVLRGLIHPDLQVQEGMKIGDVDPRNQLSYSWMVSDKALAIGGGVLEAILTLQKIRKNLWQ